MMSYVFQQASSTYTFFIAIKTLDDFDDDVESISTRMLMYLFKLYT